jgi:hypothetical protein
VSRTSLGRNAFCVRQSVHCAVVITVSVNEVFVVGVTTRVGVFVIVGLFVGVEVIFVATPIVGLGAHLPFCE